MENLFLFWFCLRDLFVKNEDTPCYARFIHEKGALALGQFQLARSFYIHDCEGKKWLSASISLKIRVKFRITKMQRSKSSVIVSVKGSRELKLTHRESTFSVNRSRVTWCFFIFDKEIAKTKLK